MELFLKFLSSLGIVFFQRITSFKFCPCGYSLWMKRWRPFSETRELLLGGGEEGWERQSI